MATFTELREAAKAAGERLFFTGKPCKKGHVAARIVYNKTCEECAKDRQRSRYFANWESEQSKRKAQRATVKDEIAARNAAWHAANRDAANARRRAARKADIDRVRKCDAERNAIRWRDDPKYRFEKQMRSGAYLAFRNKGFTKRSATARLLGCDWETLRDHIAGLFKPGMTWDNFGDWHVDHVVPLASAESPERIAQLCHFTNLQPLWAADNLKKGGRIVVDVVL